MYIDTVTMKDGMDILYKLGIKPPYDPAMKKIITVLFTIAITLK